MEADASGVEAVVIRAVNLEGNSRNNGVEGVDLDLSDLSRVLVELGDLGGEVSGVGLLRSRSRNCLVGDSGLRVGNVSTGHVVDLAGAGCVNECEEGCVAVLDNVCKSCVVARLESFFDVTRSGSLLGLEHTGSEGGDHFLKDLCVGLNALNDEGVGDESRKAVGNRGLECGGGVGRARNSADVGEGGILLEEGADVICILGAEVDRVGVNVELDSADLAVGGDAEGDLHGLLGVLSGSLSADYKSLARGLLVDSDNGFGNARESGGDLLEVLSLGHYSEQGSELRALVVFRDDGGGDEVETEHYRAENDDEAKKDRNGINKMFDIHYLIPPRGFFFVQSLIKGTRRFMVRIAIETPSG